MINLGRAQISRTENGITVDDPESPWLVYVAVGSGPTRITHITVESREGERGITATRLGTLPVQQLLHVAAAQLLDTSHPGEAYYRMLAAPKPPGSRHWPATHWVNVARVAQWATETKRPGGPAKAISDLWGVKTRPTAYRWLGQVRDRALAARGLRHGSGGYSISRDHCRPA